MMDVIKKLCFMPLWLCSVALLAQNKSNYVQDTLYLQVFDVYGLKIKVEKLLYTDNCICGEKKTRNKCSLYEISVSKVYFIRDTSLYQNAQNLQRIKYLLTDAHEAVKIGQEYYITAYNSTVLEYIILDKLFEKEVVFGFANQLASQSGLMECYKLNFFEKMLLLFGKSRDKIYQKADKRLKTQNPFWRRIQSAT